MVFPLIVPPNALYASSKTSRIFCSFPICKFLKTTQYWFFDPAHQFPPLTRTIVAYRGVHREVRIVQFLVNRLEEVRFLFKRPWVRRRMYHYGTLIVTGLCSGRFQAVGVNYHQM